MSTKIYRYDLKKLVHFVDDKTVAVPEFQRGYVWKITQVKKLFDSLAKHYPIGSFILWETTKKIDARTINGEKLPKHKYLLLDGQQRLLSIYYLCRQNKFIQHQIKDKFHEICDNRQKDLIDFELFYLKRENREVVLNYSKEKSCEFNYKKFQNLLGDGYKFPVIVVSLDNYEKAIQIFERINQAGTRISTESIFLSETWSIHSNLGKILRDWKSTNKGSLTSSIDTIIFIHVFALIFQLEKKNEESNGSIEIGINVLKKIAETLRNEKSGKYDKQFQEVVFSVARAVTYLKEEFGIKKLTELPSQTMITVLSVFFYYQQRPLNNFQKVELRKWFWRSSLDNRYIGSGYTQNIGIDARKMKNLAKSNIHLNLSKVVIGFSKLADIDLRTGRSTLRNIMKQALWQQCPVFVNGTSISRDDVELGQHKPEDDHFFPYDLYRKGLIGNEINNILNIHFLNKDENIRKGKKLPSEWLKERIDKVSASPKDFKKYLESQLLPFKDLKGIRWSEKALKSKNNNIKKKEFLRNYWGFLWRRYKIFRRVLDRLQDGKIK